jgi:hypothetical protein
MSGTVLYGTWLKTGDGIRNPLLWETTPILRRSVGHGFILIYSFKTGGRSRAWSMYPFRLLFITNTMSHKATFPEVGLDPGTLFPQVLPRTTMIFQHRNDTILVPKPEVPS